MATKRRREGRPTFTTMIILKALLVAVTALLATCSSGCSIKMMPDPSLFPEELWPAETRGFETDDEWDEWVRNGPGPM